MGCHSSILLKHLSEKEVSMVNEKMTKAVLNDALKNIASVSRTLYQAA